MNGLISRRKPKLWLPSARPRSWDVNNGRTEMSSGCLGQVNVGSGAQISLFRSEVVKVWNILVIASPSSEGPFTIRFADSDIVHCRPRFVEFATAAVVMTKWIGAQS